MTYIEKEPIIEFITKGLNNPDKTKAFGYDAIEILAEIEYAPTVGLATEKEGRWLVNPDGWYPYCSECRSEPKSGELTNFCPNCGAKMEGANK